jgi:DNA topoisomerase-3
MGEESFFSSFRVLLEEGYLKIAANSFARKKASENEKPAEGEEEPVSCDTILLAALQNLKKNDILQVEGLSIKEGETSPPKRYNSGSMILAMENAGQLIEDEELRAQIKGAGIGTSATRAEILKKLFTIKYLTLNKKTQVITPTLLGEMIFDVVNCSIRQLLNPELTASWEKGLNYVAEGSITQQEYMDKLENFVRVRTNQVKNANNQYALRQFFDAAAVNYKKTETASRRGGK